MSATLARRFPLSRPSWAAGVLWGVLGLTCAPSWSAPAAAVPTATQDAPDAPVAPAVVVNSAMDAQLFYQLLVAEVQSKVGEVGTAYQVYLDAAKRTQNAQLYQRAVEIALQAHAGEQALSAAKAWRQAMPQSRAASEFTAQILIALGRTTDLAAPLRSLIQLSPVPEQPQVITGLPRSLRNITDRQAAAQLMDEVTLTWRQPPLEWAEAWAVSSEGWVLARNADKAMASLQRAAALKPELPVVGLLAVDLLGFQSQAEPLLQTQLASPHASNLVRLAYARKLAGLQRFEDAATQLDILVKAQPEQMGSWLTLAAVRLELRQLDPAEAALQAVLKSAKGPSPKAPDDDEAPTRPDDANADLQQAYMLMAQVAEQREQWQAAIGWLDKADPEHQRMGIQTLRARLLLRQGKLSEARAAVRALPESEPRDAALKVQTEAQLLRDAKQFQEAYKLLIDGERRFPQDTDLLYDQAMVADKLKKYEDMERALRLVVQLTPDNANAYNALGYSLADRGVRLDEARQLLVKALELRPGDPFITDSQGWLAFRAGQGAEAMRLLKQAYLHRPDPEIGAHLGEVLWSQGRLDEAREILRESVQREQDNETLQDTLKRLKLSL